ncbi:MAG: PIG-L family deacetylase [Erythrobacter sp.]|uniref:PIG-L family deacetylase n=1 Tax=Erythrobacter sp. TaxID=1042 RepID=UPI002628FDEE|nr:PIG-L family deacetylase [Erythrobacter sp.]MDJ0978235.1 PIG-L family deacetylase [Erythrobacter sp.]
MKHRHLSRTLAPVLALIATAASGAVGDGDTGRARTSDEAILQRQAPASQPEPVTPARPAPPSMLAILAHPDDEITIAPVLSRVARSGGEVTLVFATSGDAGPGSSELARGEELAQLREKEGRCAAFALGLDEPVFWKLGDGELATMARADDSAAKRALAQTREAILAAKPEVVVTWGPDGGYGHADHRMISALVTQVVAEMGLDRPDLLYAAFPQVEPGVLPGFDSWATTSPDLLTDRIRYKSADLGATQDALNCYQTQFPAAVREGLIPLLHQEVWQGVIHFRLAFPATP